MRKTFFILLAVATIVFVYKILPVRSAEDICSCKLDFSIADADNRYSICSQSINIDSDDDSLSIAKKLFEKCEESGNVPNNADADTVVSESFEGVKQCKDKQKGSAYPTVVGELSYTLKCGHVSVSAPAPSGASAEKTADQLLADAAGSLNPAGITNPTQLVGRFIKILLAFVGSISLVLYIVAGILWMTASGVSERVDKAKKILVWTTLGVVVMLASYMLASFVFKSLGL